MIGLFHYQHSCWVWGMWNNTHLMHHMELSFSYKQLSEHTLSPRKSPGISGRYRVCPLANNVKKMLHHFVLQEVRLSSWPGISTSLHKAPNTKTGRLSQNLGRKDMWIREEGWLGRRTDGKHEDEGRRKEAWHIGIKSDSSLWREKGSAEVEPSLSSPTRGTGDRRYLVGLCLLPSCHQPLGITDSMALLQKCRRQPWHPGKFLPSIKSNDLQGCVWDMATHMAGTVSYILPELPPATSLPAKLLSH